jgi:hypothetical protein
VTAPDLVVALRPVLDTLQRLRVRHYVGGSIASSAHGIPRASIDADVVAELTTADTGRLTAALSTTYYVPEERVRDAVARRGSFNLIHLETMVKVDVFVSRDRPHDRRAFERARTTPLEGGGELPIASAEDTVLAKLEWFRKGGETSQRQWGDVTGVLRAARELDHAYLKQGALELGVLDLLSRAIEEAEGNGERDG